MASRRERTLIRYIIQDLYDGPHATPPPAQSGPIFLGIENISEDGRLLLDDVRHIDESDYPNWTQRVTPRRDDIVFSYEATLGRYAIIPDDFRGCLGRRLALIRVDPSKVDSKYLFYSFFSRSWKNTIKKNTIIGSTVNRIPLSKFKDFEIEIHPLGMQKRIAAILSAYDDLIENNSRRIKILEEMARSLYREWFVHFRFPGHEEAELVDSPQGKVPAGWHCHLGDVLTLQRGFDLPERERRPGTIPIVSSSGITGYHDVAKESPPGVVTGRYGTLGEVFFIDEPYWPLNTTLYVRDFKENNPHFVLHLLRLMNFGRQNAAGAVPGVNRNALHLLPALAPPKSLQSRFGRLAAEFFSSAQVLHAKNQNLRQTRDLLLPRLISGEIDVSSLPDPVRSG